MKEGGRMQVGVECTLYLDMEKDESQEEAKARIERILESTGLEALVFCTKLVDEEGHLVREW